jgi:hypothetical protein
MLGPLDASATTEAPGETVQCMGSYRIPGGEVRHPARWKGFLRACFTPCSHLVHESSGRMMCRWLRLLISTSMQKIKLLPRKPLRYLYNATSYLNK